MSSIPGFFPSTDYTNTCPYYSELAPTLYEDFTAPYVFTGGGGSVIASGDAFLSSEKLGIVPAFSAEYPNADLNNNGMESLHGPMMIPGNQNLGGQGFGNNNMINVPRFDHAFDRLGDEYCCAASTFLPEFNPGVNLFAGGQNSLGTQSNQMHGIDQDSNTVKVGRYSEEEKKERIERYLKKRNQRNFNKTIKYACRKTLADRRVRVRGRFARNNSDVAFDHNRDDNDKKEITPNPKMEDVEDGCSNKSDLRRDLWVEDVLDQIKYEEDEDWLQNFALCCWVDEGSAN